MIATKCGIILEGGTMRYDGSRAHVRSACEASLKRLGIDCIDVYYLHSKLTSLTAVKARSQATILMYVLMGRWPRIL